MICTETGRDSYKNMLEAAGADRGKPPRGATRPAETAPCRNRSWCPGRQLWSFAGPLAGDRLWLQGGPNTVREVAAPIGSCRRSPGDLCRPVRTFPRLLADLLPAGGPLRCRVRAGRNFHHHVGGWPHGHCPGASSVAGHRSVRHPARAPRVARRPASPRSL